MKSLCLAMALVMAATSLTGCGGDEDNGSESQIVGRGATEQGQVVPVSMASDKGPLFKGEDAPPPGVLFKYIPFTDSYRHYLKCQLGDSAHSNEYAPMGLSILGGAVLGLIIRMSGRPFLGRIKGEHEPLNPTPTTPHEDFWLWHLWQTKVKSPFRGAMQGAAVGAVCEAALTGTGLNLIGIPGLLGADYQSASAAIVMAGMGMNTILPLRRIFGKPIPESWKPVTANAMESPFQTGESAQSSDGAWISGDPSLQTGKSMGSNYGGREAIPRGLLRRSIAALHNSGAGKIVRFKLAPLFSLVFVGAGIAFVTYDYLQNIDTDENADKARECGGQSNIIDKSQLEFGVDSNLEVNP